MGLISWIKQRFTKVKKSDMQFEVPKVYYNGVAEITPDLVRKTFIKNFTSFENVSEVNGKNRSKTIDAWNLWIKAGLGAPYCATAISKAFEMTELELSILIKIPKTASSQSMWFDTNSSYKIKHPIFGAVGIMYNYKSPVTGHALACVSSLEADGRTFKTFECNTNRFGSRDGEGCMFALRDINGDMSKGFRGFIDVGSAYKEIKKGSLT